MAYPYLNFNAVAELAGVSRQAIYYAVEKGLIPTEEVAPGVVLIRTSAAERYVRARESGKIKSGWKKGRKRT